MRWEARQPHSLQRLGYGRHSSGIKDRIRARMKSSFDSPKFPDLLWTRNFTEGKSGWAKVDRVFKWDMPVMEIDRTREQRSVPAVLIRLKLLLRNVLVFIVSACHVFTIL
jgi:hypothetical protein